MDFTVTDRRGQTVDRFRRRPLFENPWDAEARNPQALNTAPVLVEDERAVAGRILGPSGAVAVVVRHRPSLPFGFTATSTEESE